MLTINGKECYEFIILGGGSVAKLAVCYLLQKGIRDVIVFSPQKENESLWNPFPLRDSSIDIENFQENNLYDISIEKEIFRHRKYAHNISPVQSSVEIIEKLFLKSYAVWELKTNLGLFYGKQIITFDAPYTNLEIDEESFRQTNTLSSKGGIYDKNISILGNQVMPAEWLKTKKSPHEVTWFLHKSLDILWIENRIYQKLIYKQRVSNLTRRKTKQKNIYDGLVSYLQQINTKEREKVFLLSSTFEQDLFSRDKPVKIIENTPYKDFAVLDVPYKLLKNNKLKIISEKELIIKENEIKIKSVYKNFDFIYPPSPLWVNPFPQSEIDKWIENGCRTERDNIFIENYPNFFLVSLPQAILNKNNLHYFSTQIKTIIFFYRQMQAAGIDIFYPRKPSKKVILPESEFLIRDLYTMTRQYEHYCKQIDLLDFSFLRRKQNPFKKGL